MKNLLYGLSTLTVLIGISYVLISPQFTELFVGERQVNEQTSLSLKEPIAFDSEKPEQILQQTGKDWSLFSEQQKLKFTIQLLSSMESRDLSTSVSRPTEFIEKINTYFETESKEHTVEKAILKILAEDWGGVEETEKKN
ncbi:hypothetical protein [Pseudalkalibacillus decolorationis]|uniref:hypothetical protein n=1 Tax=Pseudalkalibacillus decolorationis TaxID=163879 RepID=UPI0021486C93|nr:hypothetical protein [Pseudalkalibacillus decolorationis]